MRSGQVTGVFLHRLRSLYDQTHFLDTVIGDAVGVNFRHPVAVAVVAQAHHQLEGARP